MNERSSGGGSGDGERYHTPVDRVFDILSHPTRRRILLVLDEANPREEAELEPGELHAGHQTLEQFRIALVHSHLPRLAEAGYIEWDRETQTIEHGPNYDEVAPLVELLRNRQDDLPDEWS